MNWNSYLVILYSFLLCASEEFVNQGPAYHQQALILLRKKLQGIQKERRSLTLSILYDYDKKVNKVTDSIIYHEICLKQPMGDT